MVQTHEEKQWACLGAKERAFLSFAPEIVRECGHNREIIQIYASKGSPDDKPLFFGSSFLVLYTQASKSFSKRTSWERESFILKLANLLRFASFCCCCCRHYCFSLLPLQVIELNRSLRALRLNFQVLINGHLKPVFSELSASNQLSSKQTSERASSERVRAKHTQQKHHSMAKSKVLISWLHLQVFTSCESCAQKLTNKSWDKSTYQVDAH